MITKTTIFTGIVSGVIAGVSTFLIRHKNNRANNKSEMMTSGNCDIRKELSISFFKEINICSWRQKDVVEAISKLSQLDEKKVYCVRKKSAMEKIESIADLSSPQFSKEIEMLRNTARGFLIPLDGNGHEHFENAMIIKSRDNEDELADLFLINGRGIIKEIH